MIKDKFDAKEVFSCPFNEEIILQNLIDFLQ